MPILGTFLNNNQLKRIYTVYTKKAWSGGGVHRVIDDLEHFLHDELIRLQEEAHGNGALCEVILIKAKLESLLVKYGYEK